MFDTMRMAKKIKEARIAKNMTQMKLAENMGVSYQAISSWERGNSMPDIAKLEPLCEILGISIDELLGSNTMASSVKKVAHPEEESELELEELETVAPMLPPDELQDFVEKTLEKEKKIDFSRVVGLAPFLEEEVWSELAEKAAVTDLEEVSYIAPFLNGKTLGKIAMKVVENQETVDFSAISVLAPFIRKGDLEKMVKKAKITSFEQIVSIAPFLPAQALREMAEKVNPENLEELNYIAPFLDSRTLGELVRKLMK